MWQDTSTVVTCVSKFPKERMKFPLKPLESGGPNELLQVDHLKLSTTEEGYQGVLMMVDHFSKYAVAKPYWIFEGDVSVDHGSLDIRVYSPY